MKPDRAHAGAAVALAGGALALLVWLQPHRLHAPAAVAYAAALAFGLAGWLLVAQAMGHERLKAWLPVALLACMATPPAWIAFAPGHRACRLAAGGLVRLVGMRSDLPCRIAFGIAAMIGVALLLLALRQALRSGREH